MSPIPMAAAGFGLGVGLGPGCGCWVSGILSVSIGHVSVLDYLFLHFVAKFQIGVLDFKIGHPVDCVINDSE